jgi:hypothetical protein
MRKLVMLTVAGVLLLGVSQVNAQKPGKWVKLFNGKNFDGWRTYNGTGVSDIWKVEDGAMVMTAKGGGNLVTEGEYGDFELELEWKISEGGNSGIMFHVHEDPKFSQPYQTGPEIQVLDDEKHPDSFKGSEGNHKAGSLYDLVPPSDLKAVKPAGQWNKAKIVVKNGRGESWLNGKKVAEFPLKGPEWEKMVENSKFKGWEGFGKYDRGRIALQDHGDKVWFRNIRIREFK